jgi:hypothetical protein
MSNPMRINDDTDKRFDDDLDMHQDDLFTKAGWIMINKYVQQEMMKPKNKEWFANNTLYDVFKQALRVE